MMDETIGAVPITIIAFYFFRNFHMDVFPLLTGTSSSAPPFGGYEIFCCPLIISLVGLATGKAVTQLLWVKMHGG
jgi:hypothetical protein